jgi:hypothetical protein
MKKLSYILVAFMFTNILSINSAHSSDPGAAAALLILIPAELISDGYEKARDNHPEIVLPVEEFCEAVYEANQDLFENDREGTLGTLETIARRLNPAHTIGEASGEALIGLFKSCFQD